MLLSIIKTIKSLGKGDIIVEWYKMGTSLYNDNLDKKLKRLVEVILEGVFLVNAEPNNNLYEVVSELSHYIEEHLKYEEMIMDNVDYPYKNEHKEEHNELRNNYVVNQISNVSSIEYVNDKLNNIVEWFTAHIVCSDNMLSKYIADYITEPKQTLREY